MRGHSRAAACGLALAMTRVGGNVPLAAVAASALALGFAILLGSVLITTWPERN